MEIVVTKNQLNSFQLLLEVYQPRTVIPPPGNWKGLNASELWLWMVGQVLVVGSSGSRERFERRADLQQYIGWEALNRLRRDSAIKARIHKVLREVGSRYTAKELESSQKTLSLFYNYRVLKGEREGFKTVLRRLERMGGEEREFRRVSYLMEHFHYLSSKSARDLLMNLGMNRGTLALDIRTQNIFQHFRLPFPTTSQLGQPRLYDAAEKQIIQQVCTPLGVEPIVLDRTLYQNYTLILRKDYLQLKLPFHSP